MSLPHENDPGRADDGTVDDDPSRTRARLSLSWAGVVSTCEEAESVPDVAGTSAMGISPAGGVGWHDVGWERG